MEASCKACQNKQSGLREVRGPWEVRGGGGGGMSQGVTLYGKLVGEME